MTTQVKHFQPLPEGVELRPSPIHGQGLFTRVPIKTGTLIGVTHVWLPKDVEPLRTVLGAYGNHSRTPNCEKRSATQGWGGDDIPISISLLYTLCDIAPGEELTWTYTLYDPEKEL